MSRKYKVHDDTYPHFVTFTVVGWVEVFSRDIYKDILVDSLRFCQENKGMQLHAWVIMTNHVHLILSGKDNKISDIVRDFKKYTSKQIIQTIKDNPAESRKEWMLNLFQYVGLHNKNNKDVQFWKQDYHPIVLDTAEMAAQRLHYLHENPVRSGLVWEAWQFKYSSAIDYYKGEKGLLKLMML